jgi:hypothetical protein
MTTEETTNDIMDAHADTVWSIHRHGVTGKAGRPVIADSAADVASSRAKISTTPKDGVTRRSVTVPCSFGIRRAERADNSLDTQMFKFFVASSLWPLVYLLRDQNAAPKHIDNLHTPSRMYR